MKRVNVTSLLSALSLYVYHYLSHTNHVVVVVVVVVCVVDILGLSLYNNRLQALQESNGLAWQLWYSLCENQFG